MGKPPLVSLSDLLSKPEEYADECVRVRGTLKYLGLTPGSHTYSVNLPEQGYAIALLEDEGRQLLCYGLEELDLQRLNGRRVELTGYLVRVGETYAFRIVKAELLEETG